MRPWPSIQMIGKVHLLGIALPAGGNYSFTLTQYVNEIITLGAVFINKFVMSEFICMFTTMFVLLP